MDYFRNVDVVVAKFDDNGRAIFADVAKPASHRIEGAVEAAYVWGFDQVPSLPGDIGTVPTDVSFPPTGGARFGLICFPAHSAGLIDMKADGGASNLDAGSTPGMHRSDTIDFEVVISGKVDIVLESGERRTLGPGSCLVMAGVMHAWENIYDEPCIYAVVVVGAKNAGAS